MSSTYQHIEALLASASQEEMEEALRLLEQEPQNAAWLKDLAALGEVQRNLLQLHIAIEAEHDEFYQKVETFEQAFNALDMNELDTHTLDGIHKELTDLHNQLQRFRQLAAPTVRLAWNTGRQELVDKCSHLRESVERDELHLFGEESHGSQKETLLTKMRSKLYSAFGATQEDSEPILDALTAFSIWAIKDYWQLGLLPKITNEEDLGIDDTTRLFDTAKNNLEKIGLKTLKDLKERSIFSRKCLLEYISRNRSLL